jgi:hypothetical protein
LGGYVDNFEESLKYEKAVAEQLEVSREIHCNDFICEFVLNHPNYATLEKTVSEYFVGGRQSTIMLSNVFVEMGYDPEGSLSMLEYALGYGCLTQGVLDGFRICRFEH